eukprot:CAMPEP_0201282522 /NCGR_PEP_ID=MMETSP1317-20130820/5869_1 /ASSEMBLY_ACC=CAM_ASM_000770 /TAXON_ID=187299 /ORGANISM="Undescribed Undescribed, Strain Undescribed" /LENGTH=35 /DNA_ID= /DNA_START= /DNA_END= /DNA_ORIENTATION=
MVDQVVWLKQEIRLADEKLQTMQMVNQAASQAIGK